MKSVNESIDILLDQQIARAEAQLEIHRKNLSDSKEMNELLEKQGKRKRSTAELEETIEFYEAQIEEIENRKTKK